MGQVKLYRGGLAINYLIQVKSQEATHSIKYRAYDVLNSGINRVRNKKYFLVNIITSQGMLNIFLTKQILRHINWIRLQIIVNIK